MRMVKIDQDCINPGLVVYSSHPVMDCLNDVRFTRQSLLESMLEVKNDIVFVQMLQHIA